ncbi:HlyD family secretion protein [Geobacter sp. OR-1]|uniref:HlyD family secretion protein n=1 Tax=Geobacter sp. OR-1 TaxID=1266765 RepID=UPI000A9FA693|nr:HlyD family secretion protein [Geobacter sp. OR-1]
MAGGISALLLVAGVCGFGWYWFSCGRYIETTDNAYVRSDITQVSPKVQGYVKDVAVRDNAFVEAGTTLVRIEDAEFRIRLENGRQKLEERRGALLVALTKARQQLSRIAVAKSQVTASEAEQSKRASDHQRFSALLPQGIVSAQDYESIATAEKKARADLSSASANMELTEKELQVLRAEEQRLRSELRQQEEEIKLLAKELSDTVVKAPIAGVVGNRRVRAGQFVKPGTLLLSLIPRDTIWIEANFKEMQLARMREGQPVIVEIDAFEGKRLTGHIESLSPASGAEYSLIPPENATGNFTKIVQRIPVRIRIEEGQPLTAELRSGMSAVVRIDTRNPPQGGVRVGLKLP